MNIGDCCSKSPIMRDTCTIQYLPEIVLDKIFSSLELPDFLSCMLVCRNWYRVLNCDRTEPWKTICERLIPRTELNTGLYLQLDNPKAIVRTFCHGWVNDECYSNCTVKQDGITLHQRGLPSSDMDTVRSKIGYDYGVQLWDVIFKAPIFTIEMIGIVTKEFPIRSHNNPMIGVTEYSWGWNILTNFVYHNNIAYLYEPYTILQNDYDSEIDLKIRLVLDCERSQLLFETSNKCIGVAFANLPKTKFYPTVSCIGGLSDISIVYIGNRLSP